MSKIRELLESELEQVVHESTVEVIRQYIENALIGPDHPCECMPPTWCIRDVENDFRARLRAKLKE